MKVCVFEDSTVSNFNPLAYLHTVFELRCGCTRLFEKIQMTYPDMEMAFLVRDYLRDVTVERLAGSVNSIDDLGDETLLINGRYLDFGQHDFSGDGEEAGVCENGVVYLRARRRTIEKYRSFPAEELAERIATELPQKRIVTRLLSYPWDLVNENSNAIASDFKRLGKSGVHGKLHEMSCIRGPQDNVYVAPSAELHPFAVIDTSGGPVFIGENVTVGPHTRVEGPAYVGEATELLGGKIREGTTIGPACRVGGEIEESIIHGYSNKYHDGFLGHCYICEWVNLGALTSNSDLKNDYSSIEVFVNGSPIDTGSIKIGVFIGDHTKLSIGSLLNSGTIIGVMNNLVVHGGLFPKFVTSFVWFINGKPLKGAGIAAMIKTARAIEKRRGVEMSEAEENLIRQVFDMTKEERRESIRRAREVG